MHNYKELLVWKKSRGLVKEIYQLSGSFPSEEKFGLTSQIRRAVLSIPTNISEGCGRATDKDLFRFLDYSFSSAFEVENLLYLSFDLEYITNDTLNGLLSKVQEIQKMIYGLKNKINSTQVREDQVEYQTHYESLDT